VYPGAPESTTFGEQDAGFVAIVFFPRHGRPPIIQKQPVAQWHWRDKLCTSLEQLDALRHQDLKDCVMRLRFKMEVGIADRVRVDDILQELKGNEAVCGKVGVLDEDVSGLEVNVREIRDFDGALPDVLKAVIARLQLQASEPASEAEGAIARQALVLFHKTLRGIDCKVDAAALSGGASGRSATQ
jgi:hypothetical protein